MKQLTINIPDAKFQYVIELLSGYSFIQIQENIKEDFVFNEEQKASVNYEFRKMEENPDYAVAWDKARHLIKVD